MSWYRIASPGFVAGESGMGFLLRTASRHGVGPRQLTRHLGLRFTGEVWRGDVVLAAKSLGCEPHLLSDALPQMPHSGCWCVGGLELASPALLRSAWSQLCPHCLVGARYHRLVWEFSAVSVCAAHRCLLIDACPTCRLPLRWDRPAVDFCPAGHRIKPVSVYGQTTPDQRLIDFTAWISGQSPVSASRSTWIDRLPREDAMALVRIAGLLSQEKSAVSARDSRRVQSVRECSAWVLRGFQLLEQMDPESPSDLRRCANRLDGAALSRLAGRTRSAATRSLALRWLSWMRRGRRTRRSSARQQELGLSSHQEVA
ncbi:TniQ family protein [Piscinibacterium candidicorallinum]|uniref:TniQ family protein n=1 Tax=Piscinibacterium candidicorallinum TaxID=1793872 RepID=A0ABV7HC86_9BURK